MRICDGTWSVPAFGMMKSNHVSALAGITWKFAPTPMKSILFPLPAETSPDVSSCPCPPTCSKVQGNHISKSSMKLTNVSRFRFPLTTLPMIPSVSTLMSVGTFYAPFWLNATLNKSLDPNILNIWVSGIYRIWIKNRDFDFEKTPLLTERKWPNIQEYEGTYVLTIAVDFSLPKTDSWISFGILYFNSTTEDNSTSALLRSELRVIP